MNKYIFFWGGVFSNFHPINGDGFTSEHLYMNAKALFFGDKEIAAQIMTAKTPREAKNLGRKVKGFDEKKWDEVKSSAMISCLEYKALVCTEFYDALLDSVDKILVEASPHDKIWGIGMAANDPNILKTELWGENLLGEALMIVRNNIL